MTTFTIDSHHHITPFGSTQEAKSNPEAERSGQHSHKSSSRYTAFVSNGGTAG